MLASISGRFAGRIGPCATMTAVAPVGGKGQWNVRASRVPGPAGALHKWWGCQALNSQHHNMGSAYGISGCRGALSALMFGGGRSGSGKPEARLRLVAYWPKEMMRAAIPEADCPPRPSESSTMSSPAQARPGLWRNYRDNLHAGTMLTVLQGTAKVFRGSLVRASPGANNYCHCLAGHELRGSSGRHRIPPYGSTVCSW